jgi:putative transcriptional regulator
VDEQTLSPALLVAMPQLADPNFRRTVILLVHHNDDGTFGLVLNRGTDLRTTDLCASLDVLWGGDDEDLVSWGGPVQPNTGWVLLGEDAEPAVEGKRVTDGIFFASSLESLRRAAEAPPDRLRLFLGYAGWSPGQLEEEIGQGAWIVAPASPRIVFDTAHDAMWEKVLEGLGINPATLVATAGVH